MIANLIMMLADLHPILTLNHQRRSLKWLWVENRLLAFEIHSLLLRIHLGLRLISLF